MGVMRLAMHRLIGSGGGSSSSISAARQPPCSSLPRTPPPSLLCTTSLLPRLVLPPSRRALSFPTLLLLPNWVPKPKRSPSYSVSSPSFQYESNELNICSIHSSPAYFHFFRIRNQNLAALVSALHHRPIPSVSSRSEHTVAHGRRCAVPALCLSHPRPFPGQCAPVSSTHPPFGQLMSLRSILLFPRLTLCGLAPPKHSNLPPKTCLQHTTHSLSQTIAELCNLQRTKTATARREFHVTPAPGPRRPPAHLGVLLPPHQDGTQRRRRQRRRRRRRPPSR